MLAVAKMPLPLGIAILMIGYSVPHRAGACQFNNQTVLSQAEGTTSAAIDVTSSGCTTPWVYVCNPDGRSLYGNYNAETSYNITPGQSFFTFSDATRKAINVTLGYEPSSDGIGICLSDIASPGSTAASPIPLDLSVVVENSNVLTNSSADPGIIPGVVVLAPSPPRPAYGPVLPFRTPATIISIGGAINATTATVITALGPGGFQFLGNGGFEDYGEFITQANPNEAFTVTAFEDVLGTGVYNRATDPVKVIEVSADTTGALNFIPTLVLEPPPPLPELQAAVSAPWDSICNVCAGGIDFCGMSSAKICARPVHNGAILTFPPIVDANGNELAEAYAIQWLCSNNTTAADNTYGSITANPGIGVSSAKQQLVIIRNLSDGDQCAFSAVPVADCGTNSDCRLTTFSADLGTITIGQASPGTGMTSIFGQVSYANASYTGPASSTPDVLVVARDANTGEYYDFDLPQLASVPLGYAADAYFLMPSIPEGVAIQVYAAYDLNLDGIIGPQEPVTLLDIQPTELAAEESVFVSPASSSTWYPPVTIPVGSYGALYAPEIVSAGNLFNNGIEAWLVTGNSPSGVEYDIYVRSNTADVLSATLLGGNGVICVTSGMCPPNNAPIPGAFYGSAQLHTMSQLDSYHTSFWDKFSVPSTPCDQPTCPNDTTGAEFTINALTASSTAGVSSSLTTNSLFVFVGPVVNAATDIAITDTHMLTWTPSATSFTTVAGDYSATTQATPLSCGIDATSHGFYQIIGLERLDLGAIATFYVDCNASSLPLPGVFSSGFIGATITTVDKFGNWALAEYHANADIHELSRPDADSLLVASPERVTADGVSSSLVTLTRTSTRSESTWITVRLTMRLRSP